MWYNKGTSKNGLCPERKYHVQTRNYSRDEIPPAQ